MKKLFLSVAMLLPLQVFADQNSVYEWGPWAEGIKPAAGPVNVAPAPVANPQADVRETLQQMRRYDEIYNQIQYSAARPAIPGAPQVGGNIVVGPPGGFSDPSGLGNGTQL